MDAFSTDEYVIPVERHDGRFVDTKIKLLLIASYQGSEQAIRLVIRYAEITRDKAALAELANDKEHTIRAAVADNAFTSAEVLYYLACDPHPDVRYTIAENACTPAPILKMLSGDSNPYVAHRAGRTLSLAFSAYNKPVELPITAKSHKKASTSEHG